MEATLSHVLDEPHRLLQETLWYFQALSDRDYSPHMLADQKQRLLDQINAEMAKYDADRKWMADSGDLIQVLKARLPDGWEGRIRPPSQSLRFTAISPATRPGGPRTLVLANTLPELLDRVAQLTEVHLVAA